MYSRKIKHFNVKLNLNSFLLSKDFKAKNSLLKFAWRQLRQECCNVQHTTIILTYRDCNGRLNNVDLRRVSFGPEGVHLNHFKNQWAI